MSTAPRLLRKAALIPPVLLLAAATTANAALNAVDPGPYQATNGFFAAWYQDFDGVALDLCLSNALSSRAQGPFVDPPYMCTLLPEPGIFDDTLPIVFPAAAGDCQLDPPDPTRCNFPNEAFWFTGDASIDAGGVVLTYVSAVEATFGGGLPLARDQVSFARIRIRVDLPADAPAGGYIVTHPYGVETFTVTDGGTRSINMTRNSAVGAPRVFTGALAGDVGPFLQSVNGPYVEGAETFIGDPNLFEEAIGSPFGTNFVRIEGPAGFALLETTLFAVSGKLFTDLLPTPLLIERTSYSRTADSIQKDVFATAPPTSTFVRFGDGGVNVGMADADANANGSWFGQTATTGLPATITVSANKAGSGKTTETNPLVDLVTVTRAEYSLSAATLIVEAASSDEVANPALRANGTLMTLVGTGPLRRGTITGLIPPAFVTVTSAEGGTDSEPVVILP